MIPREYFNVSVYSAMSSDMPIFSKNPIVLPAWFPLIDRLSDKSYSIDEIVKSVYFYYKQEKSCVIFDSSPEGFSINFMKTMDAVLKKLLTTENYTNIYLNDFYYVSGALPIFDNINAYSSICLRNNFTKINLILINTWEEAVLVRFLDKIKYFENTINIKSKKFVSMNGAAREARIYFTLLMLDCGLIDKGYYSISMTNSKDKGFPNTGVFDNNFYLRMRKVYAENSHRFPLTLTRKINQEDNFFEEDRKIFSDCYFNIVQETNFLDIETGNHALNFKETIFFTEKTFRSMAFLKPFVILGRPNSLDGLRKYGYLTFSPYIDESYDKIENDKERMLAVSAEVERLCNLNDEQWLEMQYRLEPILVHNYNKLINSKMTVLTHFNGI